MQHTQQNYKSLIGCGALLGLVFFGAFPVIAGTVAPSTAQDLLHESGPLPEGEKGPCDPALAGADLVPGVDVNGRKVAEADPDAVKIPMPRQILMPLGGANAPLAVIDHPVPQPPDVCPPARR